MEIKRKNKQKGNITIFAIIILSFISWAIFSTSFLISEELFILKDKKELTENQNKENLLEIIFLEKINEIENQIINNEETKDIIWYFMKKDKNLFWTNNYETFQKSDNGYIIEKIFIKNYSGDEKTYDFTNWNKNFRYANLIENNSIPKKRNKVIIYFSKELKNAYIEKMEDKKFNIKISGQVHTEYIFEKRFNEDALLNYELKELKFEIY